MIADFNEFLLNAYRGYIEVTECQMERFHGIDILILAIKIFSALYTPSFMIVSELSI